MAKPPIWMTMKHTGATDTNNMGVELCIKWWCVPFVFLWALITPREEVADSCDGLEVTGIKWGKCK